MLNSAQIIANSIPMDVRIAYTVNRGKATTVNAVCRDPSGGMELPHTVWLLSQEMYWNDPLLTVPIATLSKYPM